MSALSLSFLSHTEYELQMDDIDAHFAAAMPSSPMAHQDATNFADEY